MNISTIFKFGIFSVLLCAVFISCSDSTTGTNETGSPTATKKAAALSNDVSKKLAQKVALNFSKTSSYNSIEQNHKLQVKSSAAIKGLQKEDIRNIIVIHDQKGAVAMYIITFHPKGFMVISGTQKAAPILGFSKKVKFNIHHLPGGLAYWFKKTAEDIKILKAAKIDSIPENIQRAWGTDDPKPGNMPIDGGPRDDTEPGPTIHEKVGPLIQAHWDQHMPYNDLTPHEGDQNLPSGIDPCPAGESCPAGCVAIAMSQIMDYWSYPSDYNWSIIPDGAAEGSPGATEVAQLVRDAGVSAKMDYESDGSSAYSKDAKDALVNTFGYTSSISYEDYNRSKVVNELDDNRPIYMEGCSEKDESGWFIFKHTRYSNCHAWDVDGYKRTVLQTIHDAGTQYEHTTQDPQSYYFHHNWGWGEYYEVWLRAGDFQATTSQSTNYQYHNKMVIGIEPNS